MSDPLGIFLVLGIGTPICILALACLLVATSWWDK